MKFRKNKKQTLWRKVKFVFNKSNAIFPSHEITIKTKSSLFALLLLLLVSSCLSRVEKRGYMFNLSDHEVLLEGVTSKKKVVNLMGSPTLISDLDAEEAWIYYSEDINNVLFFKPKITSRTMLVLKFDQLNVIKDLKKIDFSDEEKKLEFNSDYTKVESHEAGLFKSIFSNVGQIKAQ
jgi:outer membrane protein assembly factor BamE (lipoprotein component of BamABCDE complex)